jgi:bifunctional DNA-binding transcriptional regulator/antitoxin component of YhaV-PrlF toxin-antitoxin module
MGIEIKVAANGRMVIPLDVRRALGLENGGSIWLEASETELTLRTRIQAGRSARDKARKMKRSHKGLASDILIAERRAEFRNELEKEHWAHAT